MTTLLVVPDLLAIPLHCFTFWKNVLVEKCNESAHFGANTYVLSEKYEAMRNNDAKHGQIHIQSLPFLTDREIH